MSKITPRDQNFSEWYNSIIKESNLAEQSNVYGSLILKPYGYSIWESIKNVLDKELKKLGYKNAYFPSLIPKSYFCKEAKHIDGFAKECAVVTHHRLKLDKNFEITVDEQARLQEDLILRPTSETIVWNSYKNWIQSHRDLPLKINQWVNVFRWEMRTRPFLRTSEFLWQEAHGAYATKEEAEKDVLLGFDYFYDALTKNLGIPFIKGIKTENETFAGAEKTYTLEALMQDGKALQSGTFHILGQSFAKSFDVKYSNVDGKLEYPYGISIGVSTRIIGALIMTHSDDKGLVLPPKIAPIQVIIIPILKKNEDKNVILNYINELTESLDSQEIRFEVDDRDYYTPGWKFNEYELKGVPVRIAIGLNDISKNQIEITRRDNSEKIYIDKTNAVEKIKNILEDIQNELYNKASNFKKQHTIRVDNYEDFKREIEHKNGFVLAHWDGTKETELKIKEETHATIRCIPLNLEINKNGKCIKTHRDSEQEVVFAQAY